MAEHKYISWNGYGYEKYIYNGFNQMTSAVAEDGTVTKYTYGSDGIRTSKKVGNNQTVYFELDRENVFKEAYADGTAVQKYRWGVGLVGNGKGEFYLKNGHGDVVQIVNSSFEVKDSYAYEYDAFGNNINKRNGDTNPFRYCSEYYDTETDSIYLRARYYNPKLGRFMSEDPIKDGTNWYGYCAGNPVMFRDPLGLEIQIDYNLSEDKRQVILSDLQSLTDYKLYIDDSEGTMVVKMSDELVDEKLGIKYEVGNSLLKGMIDNDKQCFIKEGKEGFNENNSTGRIEIEYDFNSKTKINTMTNDGGMMYSNRPTYIALAHELIHGYHDMRGIQKSNEEAIYSVTSMGTQYTGEVVTTMYKYSEEEVFTVGLGDYAGYRITENSIRAEHGLNLRGVY